jgi:hypothetical protein
MLTDKRKIAAVASFHENYGHEPDDSPGNMPEDHNFVRSRKRKLTISTEPILQDTGHRYEPKSTEKETLSGILKRKPQADIKFRIREILNYFYTHSAEFEHTAELLSKLAHDSFLHPSEIVHEILVIAFTDEKRDLVPQLCDLLVFMKETAYAGAELTLDHMQSGITKTVAYYS